MLAMKEKQALVRKSVPLSIRIDPDLAERVRDVAYHFRTPVSKVVEDALGAHLDKLSREYGPTPPRSADVPKGRPIRARS